MKRFIISLAAVLCILFLTIDVQAQARLQGRVTNQDGKPVASAEISIHSERGGVQDPIYTDENGNWAILLPIGGSWNIDVRAEGYQPSLGTLEVSEIGRNPKVKTVLERRPEPKPQQVVPQGPSVSQEAMDAIDAGERYMREAAGKELVETRDDKGNVVDSKVIDAASGPPGAERQKELYQKAAASFETALKEFEGNPELARSTVELKKALARAHYASGNLDRAIALLEDVLKAEPDNAAIALLQVNLLAEKGEIERAKALIDSLPQGTFEDPTAVINVGILFLNKGNATTAHEYFDRAVAIDPERGESYYYRAIASLQLEEMADARADFERVIALAPDSSEAADAKGMLEQL